MVPRDRILNASDDRVRQRRTSCRHGDFQTKFLKIKKMLWLQKFGLISIFISIFQAIFGFVWNYLTLTSTIWAPSNAYYHYRLPNVFFTRRDPHDCRFVQDIIRCLRSDRSATNRVLYDTPGSPLIYPSICDPCFPVVVFLPQLIAV